MPASSAPAPPAAQLAGESLGQRACRIIVLCPQWRQRVISDRLADGVNHGIAGLVPAGEQPDLVLVVYLASRGGQVTR